MKRYFVKFIGFRDYALVDRYHNSIIIRGSLEAVNARADELGDCEEAIEY